jgi:hypothetical protein
VQRSARFSADPIADSATVSPGEHSVTNVRPTPRRSALLGLALATMLAACAAGTSGPSATLSASPSSASTTQPSPSAAASSSPDDELGPFACDMPVTGSATTPRAQITDVRVGAHDGYDRIVFEFDSGTPQYRIDRAEPPLREDASGRPLDVAGSSFLSIVLTDASRALPEGGLSYHGPLVFTPRFDALVELVEGGDFEAVSTWYAGLRADSCLRVLTLDSPSRLVIDVEH